MNTDLMKPEQMNEDQLEYVKKQIIQIYLFLISHTGYDPKVVEVMTSEVVAVRPATLVEEAMAVITEKRIRHLPVVDKEGLLKGMVSSGDLTRWASRHQEIHIMDLVNYITGKYPG